MGTNKKQDKTLAQIFASAVVKTKNAADKVKVHKGAAFAALMLHLRGVEMGETFAERLEAVQTFYRDATAGRSAKDRNTIGTNFSRRVGPDGSFQMLATMLSAWSDETFQKALDAQMENVERDGNTIGKKDEKKNFLKEKAVEDAAKEWRDRTARLASVPEQEQKEAEKFSTFAVPALFLMKEASGEIVPVETAGEFADSCEKAAETMSKAAQSLRELAERALHKGNPVPLLSVNKRGEEPSITIKSSDDDN